MTKKEFITKWEESDDRQRLNLLEDNRSLKMVVMLAEDETTVSCDSDDEIFLRFDYCQGGDIVVCQNLNKMHIKYQRVG